MHVDAKRLTYWEFTALRHGWNELHRTGDDNDPVDLPDESFVREAQAELYELGIAGKAPN